MALRSHHLPAGESPKGGKDASGGRDEEAGQTKALSSRPLRDSHGVNVAAEDEAGICGLGMMAERPGAEGNPFGFHLKPAPGGNFPCVAVMIACHDQDLTALSPIPPAADRGHGFRGLRGMKHVAQDDKTTGVVGVEQGGEPGEVVLHGARWSPKVGGAEGGIFAKMHIRDKDRLFPDQSPRHGGKDRLSG